MQEGLLRLTLEVVAERRGIRYVVIVTIRIEITGGIRSRGIYRERKTGGENGNPAQTPSAQYIVLPTVRPNVRYSPHTVRRELLPDVKVSPFSLRPKIISLDDVR